MKFPQDHLDLNEPIGFGCFYVSRLLVRKRPEVDKLMVLISINDSFVLDGIVLNETTFGPEVLWPTLSDGQWCIMGPMRTKLEQIILKTLYHEDNA